MHDLEQALVRAATAHGEHEARNGGEYDEQWPAWYAAYMVAEQVRRRTAPLTERTDTNNTQHPRRNERTESP